MAVSYVTLSSPGLCKHPALSSPRRHGGARESKEFSSLNSSKQFHALPLGQNLRSQVSLLKSRHSALTSKVSASAQHVAERVRTNGASEVRKPSPARLLSKSNDVSPSKACAPLEGPISGALRQTPEMRSAFVQRAVDEACYPSEDLFGTNPIVRGYDFNQGVNHKALLQQMLYSGFQATHFGQAVTELNRMLDWRLSDEPVTAETPVQWRDPGFRQSVRAKLFLGYTSNMTTSGNREIIRYLAQHAQVDVMVTSAGGIEEDFIKCLAPTFVGSFELHGPTLRKRGLNRTGNLLTPNRNYVKFHDFALKVLAQMLKEQEELGVNWTPSKMIHRFGREINHPDSIYYWCYKNNVRVYCPSITDGSFGEILYFLQNKISGPKLRIDIAEDIVNMTDETIMCPPQKRGIILLGGGLPKHHICNANLLAGGADFAVLVNTANEFDGCDSGARADEAKSWGKIKDEAQAVKIFADATLVFPLLVAETFAPRIEAQKASAQAARERQQNGRPSNGAARNDLALSK